MNNKLVELAIIKEKQVFAFSGYYASKVDHKKLQEMIDAYSKSLAEGFVDSHKTELADSTTKTFLINHLTSCGANKPHSGYRFFEALYKELYSPQNEIPDERV